MTRWNERDILFKNQKKGRVVIAEIVHVGCYLSKLEGVECLKLQIHWWDSKVDSASVGIPDQMLTACVVVAVKHFLVSNI